MYKSPHKVISSVVDQSLHCVICGKSVPLETAKTDECGKAVHEQCYIWKIIFEQTNATAA